VKTDNGVRSRGRGKVTTANGTYDEVYGAKSEPRVKRVKKSSSRRN
jgi:hypothetical protein